MSPVGKTKVSSKAGVLVLARIAVLISILPTTTFTQGLRREEEEEEEEDDAPPAPAMPLDEDDEPDEEDAAFDRFGEEAAMGSPFSVAAMSPRHS